MPRQREHQPQLAARGIAFPWLFDVPGDPLGKQLGIDSIPRAVLIAADGRIVVNGRPESAAAEAALDLLLGDKR